ncbi:MAG: hypothetical protein LW806_09140, partial [Planctomycetaceae bacterium]|nr:hypothetical protein [Planctomycetaceae bacterium]
MVHGASAIAARSLASFAGLVALSATSLCKAAEIHVPADHATIQAAINASANGDTVVVAPGTYTELVRLNGKAITLRSEAGAGKTIIDGGALGTTVKFVNSETSSTVLEGFTIRNGRAAVGGGMYINSASPTIRDCVIASNIALDRGGGVAAVNARPTFTDCVFDANRATERGGGVYMIVNSDITFTGCDFNLNEARNRNAESAGGAVAAETSSDPTFANCTFTGNKAEPDGSEYDGDCTGGALYVAGPTATVQSCTFTGNHATMRGGDTARGGAIFSIQSPVINGSTFASNFVRSTSAGSGSGYGGAIYVSTSLELANCTLTANHASDSSSSQGGAVWCGSSFAATDCSFESNFTKALYGFGGAVWFADGATIERSVFELNHNRPGLNNYDQAGGALFASDGDVIATETSFIQNGLHAGVPSSRYGGAIVCPSLIELEACTFNGNQSVNYGGAVYGSTVHVSATAFTGNTCEEDGGAIYSEGDATLEDCDLSSNYSSNRGGAVFSPGTASIVESNFTSNRARYGGAMYCGELTGLLNSMFVGNLAQDEGDARGGAIECTGSYAGPITGCSFVGNRTRSLYSSTATGGAIHGNALTSVSNCTFAGNSAEGGDAYGGAISCYGGQWSGCDFISNSATTPTGTAHGGAVRVDRGYTDLATFTNCGFNNNITDGSDTRGGAIYRYGYRLDLNTCTLVGNSAQPINVANCRFEKNTGSDGAGIWLSCARRLQMTGNVFSTNLAFSSGGGVYLQGYCMYNSQLANNTFYGNIATYGGGIRIDSCGCCWQLPMNNCLFASNVATEGGAVYNSNGSCTYLATSNSTFCGNSPQDFYGYWQNNGGNIFGSGTDCNDNGICDGADIGLGTSIDCNGNGVPDECDLASGTVNDVNANGIPDACETDCDSDGVPDEYALENQLVPDCNANAVPDSCDISN